MVNTFGEENFWYCSHDSESLIKSILLNLIVCVSPSATQCTMYTSFLKYVTAQALRKLYISLYA